MRRVEDRAFAPVDASAPVPADQLRELVRDAAAGLRPADRDAIEPALRPDRRSGARLSRVRARLERAIGLLLLARTGTCPALTGILDGWAGRLDPALLKRLGRHVDRCPECGARPAELAHPALLAALAAGGAGTWWFAAGPHMPPDEDQSDDPARRVPIAAVAGTTAALAVFVLLAALLTHVAGPIETPPGPSGARGDRAVAAGGVESTAARAEPGQTRPATDTNADLDRTATPAPFGIDVPRFDVACAADGRSYVLTVRVTGTRPVRAATVFWHASGGSKPGNRPQSGSEAGTGAGPETLTLTGVDPVTREGSRAGMRLPAIEWWVEALAVDGTRTATGRRTATNPC